MILVVKNEALAHTLYMNQREFCDKYSIRVVTKETDMYFTKRTSFLVGCHVELVSPKYYVKELNNKANIKEGEIEIKK